MNFPEVIEAYETKTAILLSAKAIAKSAGDIEGMLNLDARLAEVAAILAQLQDKTSSLDLLPEKVKTSLQSIQATVPVDQKIVLEEPL